MAGTLGSTTNCSLQKLRRARVGDFRFFEASNAARWKGSLPADIAFIAMAHYQLGNMKETQAFLQQLRELMKTPKWAKDEESQGYLKEVEALVKGKSVGRTK